MKVYERADVNLENVTPEHLHLPHMRVNEDFRISLFGRRKVKLWDCQCLTNGNFEVN